MKNNLIIVESPAKARTLQRILGSDYHVMASIGHVRDLPKKELGVDIDDGFKPRYVTVHAKKVLPQLKKAARQAAAVFLAPDPDREGEAIAWHLKEALSLSDDAARRVTFHEITPQAVKAAFAHPGSIDMDKVYAQQARRILDRIVGYKISPILWKKIAKGLSAGRVQSVALRFVVEREKEIQAFVPEEFWRISARFDTDPPFEASLEHRYIKPASSCPSCGGPLSRRSGKTADVFRCAACKVSYRSVAPDLWQENLHVASESAANDILSRLSPSFSVASFDVTERRSKPLPPFTTSLLQQAAGNELGFAASRTMRIAQGLYEGIEIAGGEAVGLITYMRTDSFNIASSAIDEVRSFIASDAGPDFVPAKPHFFKSRRGAQEAHEAIRPTSVLRTPASLKPYLSAEQFKLYDLVWRRFVASQTEPSRYSDRKAELRNGEFGFLARGRFRTFAGSERYWPQRPLPALPSLDAGSSIQAVSVLPSQHFTQPPPRYSDATLVKTLEKEGIGRPSTYASIISTLSQRGYVQKIDRRFHPTELGCIVAERLIEHFPGIMDVGFTAQMETALDEVEENRRAWVDLLRDFWNDLEPALDKALADMEKTKGEIFPGLLCPECGSPMVVRLSRRGKFLGCSTFPKCKGTSPVPGSPEAQKPRRKSRPIGEKCPDCGKDLMLRSSRRGPFVGCSGFPKCRFTRNVSEEELARLNAAGPASGGTEAE
ncbi:MAG: type I DNA topoisomerase [Planctomycetes bacterium]|nr:type I DNA topoisomerase [Planctomycetota bacterium]